MKKLILGLFSMALCININAQSVNTTPKMMPAEVSQNGGHHATPQNGKGSPSNQSTQGAGDWTRVGWYDYIDHALNISQVIPTVTFTSYVDAIFPDSLAKQFYTDPTTNKPVFYYSGTQTRGTIFDPTSIGFDSLQLTPYSSYTIDSIAFNYCYFRTADSIANDNLTRYILGTDTSHVTAKADSAVKYFIVKDTAHRYINLYKPIIDAATRYLIEPFSKSSSTLTLDTVYKDTTSGGPAGRYVSTSGLGNYILTNDHVPTYLPVAPDTIIIDVFGPSDVGTTLLQFTNYPTIHFRAGIVPYSRTTGLLPNGSGAEEIKYVFQRGDTTHRNSAGNYIFKEQVFALPSPIKVSPAIGFPKSNQLSGFVVTFRPGYKYSLGDTMSADTVFSGKPIHKRLNTFMLGYGEDGSGQQSDTGFNGSIAAYKSQEYGTATNWLTDYLPSAGVSTATSTPTFVKDYMYSFFHISTVVSGINNHQALNIPNMIYPNPAQNQATLVFTLAKPGMVNIDIYDLVGHKVQNVTSGNMVAGKQLVNINTENLSSGMYFYTITVDGASETNKFSVSK